MQSGCLPEGWGKTTGGLFKAPLPSPLWGSDMSAHAEECVTPLGKAEDES